MLAFAIITPNMSLNGWIKEQEQRGVTTFSVEQIRSVFSERSEKALKIDINRLVLSKVFNLCIKASML